MPERRDEGAGSLAARHRPIDPAYPKEFWWSRTRSWIQYAGPLASKRPEIAHTVARGPQPLPVGAEANNFVQWLLAEPESLHLHAGLAGSRTNETERDRRWRLARKQLSQEAGKAKAVNLGR